MSRLLAVAVIGRGIRAEAGRAHTPDTRGYGERDIERDRPAHQRFAGCSVGARALRTSRARSRLALAAAKPLLSQTFRRVRASTELYALRSVADRPLPPPRRRTRWVNSRLDAVANQHEPCDAWYGLRQLPLDEAWRACSIWAMGYGTSNTST